MHNVSKLTCYAARRNIMRNVYTISRTNPKEITMWTDLNERLIVIDIDMSVDILHWSVFICHFYQVYSCWQAVESLWSLLSFGGSVVVVIVWQLDLQLHMQSMSISDKVLSSNPVHGEVYSIQHYVIEFISNLRQVGGFLRVLRFPPPIKLPATI